MATSKGNLFLLISDCWYELEFLSPEFLGDKDEHFERAGIGFGHRSRGDMIKSAKPTASRCLNRNALSFIASLRMLLPRKATM